MSDLNDKQITDIANFHHVGRDTNGMRLFTDYSLLAFARAILASRTEPEATAPAQDLSAAITDAQRIDYIESWNEKNTERGFAWNTMAFNAKRPVRDQLDELIAHAIIQSQKDGE